jgi:transcriptional regulator of arginine metabolism
MQKRERHNVLLKLISESPRVSQAGLAEQLTGSGFRVTQASVSRDLDELGFFKRNGRYIRVTNGAGRPKIRIESAGENLVIVKCEAGLASAVAVQIDKAGFAEIVGTIAGDDTIFLAVKDVDARDRVIGRLNELF